MNPLGCPAQAQDSRVNQDQENIFNALGTSEKIGSSLAKGLDTSRD
jgi:hypothetical protein